MRERAKDLDVDFIEDFDEELPNHLGDSVTYKNKFPFGKHFTNSLNRGQIFFSELENKYADSVQLEDNNFSSQMGRVPNNSLYLFLMDRQFSSTIITIMSAVMMFKRYSGKLDENREKNILVNEV